MNDNQEPIVSGRELHKFLELGTEYAKWFNRMIEYGFIENVDFNVFVNFDDDETAFGGKRKITDHILKLDMAKEISMLQRNEKGKQARKYFIQVEKDYNSPEKIMARALKFAEVEINTLQIQTKEQQKQIEIQDKEIDRYSRFLCDKLQTITKTELATRLDTSTINVAKILKALGIYTAKTNKISTKFLDMHPNIKIIIDHLSTYQHPKTGETIETKTWKYTAEGSKAIVDYLVQSNLVTFCENKGFKLNKLTSEEAFSIIQNCKI